MQLTDPSEYEGGNLEILTRANPDIVRKELGLIAFFPSWTLHQVTPVTRGERQTLVTWATGPNFT
jgi:PKHD-type hydroxylase